MKFVYLQTVDFAAQAILDALPLLRDVLDLLAERLQQVGVAKAAERLVILSDAIHFRLVVRHIVQTFLFR